MPDFKTKNPNSISAGAPPQISLFWAYSALPHLLTEFSGPTSTVLEKRWEMGFYEEGEGMKEAASPRVGSHPMSKILKKPDCKTHLIGGATGAGALAISSAKACSGVDMLLSPQNIQIRLPSIINRTASQNRVIWPICHFRP